MSNKYDNIDFCLNTLYNFIYNKKHIDCYVFKRIQLSNVKLSDIKKDDINKVLFLFFFSSYFVKLNYIFFFNNSIA